MKKGLYLIAASAGAAILLVAFLFSSAYFSAGPAPPLSAQASNNNTTAVVVGANNNNNNNNYTGPENLTDNPEDSVYGQVAASLSTDNVYVVWQDSVAKSSYGRNYDIYVKKSTDSGVNFGDTIVNLSNNSGFSEHPQISASGNDVYIVWADDSSGNREILFAKSSDNGTTYQGPVNLSNDTNDSYNAEVASSENNVYIIWQDQDDEGNGRILVKTSTDSGETFGDAVTISNNIADESFPKIATFGDNVYVAWSVLLPLDESGETGMFFATSTDRGNTFGETVKLSENNSFGEGQLAAYGNSVYVVWGGLGEAEVNSLFLAKSTDSGSNFTEPRAIGEGFDNPLNVEIATRDETNLHIAVQAFVSGNEEILLLSSADGGETFDSYSNLSNNSGVSECPSIAVTENNIYTVWEDLTPGNHEVLYARL